MQNTAYTKYSTSRWITESLILMCIQYRVYHLSMIKILNLKYLRAIQNSTTLNAKYCKGEKKKEGSNIFSVKTILSG